MIKQNVSTKRPKIDSTENETTTIDEEREVEQDEDEEESNEDEEDSDGEEEFLDDDEQIEKMEKLDVEFEALPPAQEDMDDIEGLLTQVFLRADIDKRAMAQAVIAQSPMGCVYRPTEECEDEEVESITYGILSIIPLNGNEKFQTSIANFLLQKAKKYSDGPTFKRFEKVLGDGRLDTNIGLLINERMLHFPAQVAGPAFSSLNDDYKNMPNKDSFEQILMILKVRICEETIANSSFGKSTSLSKRKKMGKAARKRMMAAQLAEADVLFDNPEEQLLFSTQQIDILPFFQYSVESEIERSSKFHSIRRGGRIYRPFRRVCLLTKDQFFAFAGAVSHTFGAC